jgi:hypothetical protein
VTLVVFRLAGAKPASARFRREKARGRASEPKDRPSRRREIVAYPNPTCSDLTRDRTRRTTPPRRPGPLRPGPADHVQGRLVPRRGWKWWTCGNGGFCDFHEAAGSHFQPICWKCEKPRETTIFRSPRPISWQCRPGDGDNFKPGACHSLSFDRATCVAWHRLPRPPSLTGSREPASSRQI